AGVSIRVIIHRALPGKLSLAIVSGNDRLAPINTFWVRACGWTPTSIGLSGSCLPVLIRPAEQRKKGTSKSGRPPVFMARQCLIIHDGADGICQRQLRG